MNAQCLPCDLLRYPEMSVGGRERRGGGGEDKHQWEGQGAGRTEETFP